MAISAVEFLARSAIPRKTQHTCIQPPPDHDSSPLDPGYIQDNLTTLNLHIRSSTSLACNGINIRSSNSPTDEQWFCKSTVQTNLVV
jgi:hypothetical protein